MQSTKQALFMIGENEYGLDIMEVNIIEKVMPVEPVAGFSSALKGMIKLRGDKIPVCSLRRKFCLKEAEQSEDTRFIITTSNGILMAYEVDKMSEIVQFGEDQIFEMPSIIKSGDTSYIKQILNVDDRLVISLDKDNILSEEEENQIKKILNK